jgi:hypothetical protein
MNLRAVASIGSLLLVAGCIVAPASPPPASPAPSNEPAPGGGPPSETAPAPDPAGGPPYRYSEYGREQFMVGCYEEGASESFCTCALYELEARYPESYVDQGQMTDAQMEEIGAICLGSAGY